MENCYIQNFLPTDDFGFDMNMHILKFHIGASHGYIETHVQEHGMLFLSGKAMYRLDDEWVPLKYLWTRIVRRHAMQSATKDAKKF